MKPGDRKTIIASAGAVATIATASPTAAVILAVAVVIAVLAGSLIFHRALQNQNRAEGHPADAAQSNRQGRVRSARLVGLGLGHDRK